MQTTSVFLFSSPPLPPRPVPFSFSFSLAPLSSFSRSLALSLTLSRSLTLRSFLTEHSGGSRRRRSRTNGHVRRKRTIYRAHARTRSDASLLSKIQRKDTRGDRDSKRRRRGAGCFVGVKEKNGKEEVEKEEDRSEVISGGWRELRKKQRSARVGRVHRDRNA